MKNKNKKRHRLVHHLVPFVLFCVKIFSRLKGDRLLAISVQTVGKLHNVANFLRLIETYLRLVLSRRKQNSYVMNAIEAVVSLRMEVCKNRKRGEKNTHFFFSTF